jgi:uncharacterized phiE125 gp8 family phage protein
MPNQTISNQWSISQAKPNPLLTPSDLYGHLRLFADESGHPDDALIAAYIAAATQAVESYTQRALMPREVTLKRANLSARLELPVYPVARVESITYVDRDGDNQTLTDFRFIGDTIPAYLEIDAPPDVLGEGRPVTVTVTAGYLSDDSPALPDVPETFKVAAKLMVGNLYENRESVSMDKAPHAMPHSFEYLLHPLRVIGV